jgi:hypothetical protein
MPTPGPGALRSIAKMACLVSAMGTKYTAVTLPFNTFTLRDERAIQYTLTGNRGDADGTPRRDVAVRP